jgi:hypothetical protein
MKPAAWMVAASAGSWLAVAAAVDRRTSVAVLFGMAGPLLVAVVTWVLSERAYRRNPESLTSFMVTAFGGKMLFFGAYVAVVLKVFLQPAIPFVASFTGYFIALHLCEALLLRRLFTS